MGTLDYHVIVDVDVDVDGISTHGFEAMSLPSLHSI
jgi:hypothetical protein